MAWISLLDVGTVGAALAAWGLVLAQSGNLRDADIPASFLCAPSLLAALLISGSHVLYALVWYSPKRFMSVCETVAPGSNPVTVFSGLVALAKAVQQLGLLGWVCSLGAEGGLELSLPLQTAVAAGAPQWLLAIALILVGQLLNLSIYRAIGKDGVYYGFKLGRPVPWSTSFPFNVGFRHPQYVGGMLSQLGVFALLATPLTIQAGLLGLVACWVLLYAATSYMEATGDNDSTHTE